MKKRSLVLLVGSNPLPNYLAALTLAPERITLLYTDATTPPMERLRDMLRARLRNTTVDTRHIADGKSAQAVRAACGGVLADAHLDYTGGTKVMAAETRMLFRDAGGADADASYVDDGAGHLRFADGRTQDLDGTAFDLDAVLGLHGFARKQPTSSLENDPKDADAEAVARWCLQEPDRVSWLYKRLSRDGTTTPIKAQKLREDPIREAIIPGRAVVPAPEWTTREIERWINFLRGTWLDQLVGTLARAVMGGAATADTGVNLTRQSRDTELDVLVMRGHRLYLLSCTTDSSVHLCKLKLFEATWRARQVGGDLARSALVCMVPEASAGALRQDVGATWGASNTPEVFDRAHLRAWLGIDQTADRSSLQQWLQR